MHFHTWRGQGTEWKQAKIPWQNSTCSQNSRLTFSNHDAQFGHPLAARRSWSFKSLRAPAFGWRLMKSKEISCLSLSPLSSALHTIEESQSSSLLQPNKSALKRDILARRTNGRLAVWKRPACLRRSRGMEESSRYRRNVTFEPDTQVETIGENPPSQM